MRAAKQRSKDNGANTAWIKQGKLGERTPFTTYNGSQEGWAERVFQEMISTNGPAKALELVQLAVKLFKEAKLWIEGVVKLMKALKRLDELYGDKELAVLSTIYRLESIELPQGPAHEVIQTLALELRIIKTRLKAVGLDASCTQTA